jgi:hypothetical protein
MMYGAGPIFLYNTLYSIAPGLPILVFGAFLIYIGVWTEERQTYLITGIVACGILLVALVLSLCLIGIAMPIIIQINQSFIYFVFIRRSTQICLAHSHNDSDCWGTHVEHAFMEGLYINPF